MASCKFISRLALLHHARGLCNKQDVHDCRPRSPLQLLAALEEYVVARPGKVVLDQLKSLGFHEREMIEVNRHLRQRVGDLTQRVEDLQRAMESARELRTFDQVALLKSKGLNNTCGLFEMLQEVLAAKADVTTEKGSTLWEAILGANWRLRVCIEHCTNIPTEEVAKQAAQCYAIYSVLSQHILAGKVLANIQAAQGKIMFQGGPLSPEQVQIFLCISQVADFAVAEDPSTRPCGSSHAVCVETCDVSF